MSQSFVIPAKAGIQSRRRTTQPRPLDARLRGHDGGENLKSRGKDLNLTPTPDVAAHPQGSHIGVPLRLLQRLLATIVAGVSQAESRTQAFTFHLSPFV